MNKKIDSFILNRIAWARNTGSFAGTRITPNEALKVILDARQSGWLPDDIRSAVDRAVQRADISIAEADIVANQIGKRYGIDTRVGACNRYQYLTINIAGYQFQLTHVATRLSQKKPGFAIANQQRFNPAFWRRLPKPAPGLPPGTRTSITPGTFDVKPGVSPSSALFDLYQYPSQYAFDCATAVIVVQYLAILGALGASQFDKKFPQIAAGPWVFGPTMHLFLQLRGAHDVNIKGDESQFNRGDVAYFNNPGVASEHAAAFSGENAIFLGEGEYYAHPFGITTATNIIYELQSRCVRETSPDLPVKKPFLSAQYYRLNLSSC